MHSLRVASRWFRSRRAARCAPSGAGRFVRARRSAGLRARLLAGLLTGLLTAAPAGAQLFGDAARVEPVLPKPLPPMPAPDATMEFYVAPTSSNRHALDPASIVVVKEKLVQYTLVITSPSGVRNFSYEAIRCEPGDRIVLAVGSAEAGWTFMQHTRWVPVYGAGIVSPVHTLLVDRMCNGTVLASTRPERLLERVRVPSKVPY